MTADDSGQGELAIRSFARFVGLDVSSRDAPAIIERLEEVRRAVDVARATLEASAGGSGAESGAAPNSASDRAKGRDTQRPDKLDASRRFGGGLTGPGRRPSSMGRDRGAPPGGLTDLDVATAGPLLRAGEISALELTNAYLDSIERHNERLGAYITVTSERAREDAARADELLKSTRRPGPLAGIPIGHKDLILTKGIRTTFHTEAYKDFVPDVDAAVVEILDRAGTVLLGKLNTYELGSGDGPVFGPARNPWDPSRQPGGSSSGSAVAVSSGLAAAATGSDAGGSIRVPAALCGVVGLKPTRGVVSRFPDQGCSMSVIGPIARNARDAALLFDVMRRHDARDPWSVPTEVTTAGARSTPRPSELVVGIPRSWLEAPMHGDVEGAFTTALETLADIGYKIRDIELPHAQLSETLGTVIAHVECAGRYRKLLDQGAPLSDFFRQLLIASQLYTASDYELAQHVRALQTHEVDSVHAYVDIICTPTVPYPAFAFDQTRMNVRGGQVNPRTGLGRYTRLSNLTGHPSLSIPCGFTREGMPVGLQLMGRPFEEATLLSIATAFDDATGWSLHRPTV